MPKHARLLYKTDAFRVMPGLVPGIHAVKQRLGVRTITLARRPPSHQSDRTLRTTTWMAGTSPAMTDRAVEERQSKARALSTNQLSLC